MTSERSPQFSNNLILWATALFIYAFYIFGHVPISDICYALSDRYTPSVYRFYVQLAGKALLCIFAVGLAYLLSISRQKMLKTAAWLLFGACLFFSYESMVKIAIEYVHFVQYGILTVLFCKIFVSRQYVAILLALLAGFLDEVYQAYPGNPLNWRDILLNVTGVIWGWLLYWTLKDAAGSRQPLLRVPIKGFDGDFGKS